MTVTVASFRTNHPQEFGNRSLYPDQAILYWIAMAQILMGLGTGAPPKVCSFVGSVGVNKVLTVTEIDFGSLSLFPLLLEANGAPNSAQVIGQVSGPPGALGTYQVNFGAVIAAEPMVALQANVQQGANPFWGPSSLTADTPPTTLADFATEMWVAHQIVLEKQAVDAARTGNDPGAKIGVVTNKSVNGASIGFDVSAITGGKLQENAGYYNQTVYGMRFWRLMRVRGSGPYQIGVGHAPSFLFFNSWGLLGSSNAWAGPFPGIAPGDTGFSG